MFERQTNGIKKHKAEDLTPCLNMKIVGNMHERGGEKEADRKEQETIT